MYTGAKTCVWDFCSWSCNRRTKTLCNKVLKPCTAGNVHSKVPRKSTSPAKCILGGFWNFIRKPNISFFSHIYSFISSRHLFALNKTPLIAYLPPSTSIPHIGRRPQAGYTLRGFSDITDEKSTWQKNKKKTWQNLWNCAPKFYCERGCNEILSVGNLGRSSDSASAAATCVNQPADKSDSDDILFFASCLISLCTVHHRPWFTWHFHCAICTRRTRCRTHSF